MKSFSLSTIAGLTLGLLLVGYTVLAWSVPSQPPPNGNTSPPLNTGSTAQTRAGDLTLQGDVVSQNKTIWGDDITLGRNDSKGIAQCGDINLNDNSASPIQKVAFHACDAIVGSFRGIVALFDSSGTQQIALNPQDKTIQAGIVTVNGDGTISPNLNSSKLQDLQAADLMAAGGGSSSQSGGAMTLVGAQSTTPIPPVCPAGWKAAATGYWNCSTTAQGTGGNGCFCGNGNSYSIHRSDNLDAYFSSSFYNPPNTSYIPCSICVVSPAIPSPQVATGSTIIYSTKNSSNGSMGGRSGADAICTNQIPPALSSKVINVHAFLSGSSSDEIRDMHTNDSDNDGVILGYYQTSNPIYAYNREWARFNQVADDWQTLLSGAISVPMNSTRDSFYTPFSYWTGSLPTGERSGNCEDWTRQNTGNAYLGVSSVTNAGWLSFGSQACNSEIRLLCAAQYK